MFPRSAPWPCCSATSASVANSGRMAAPRDLQQVYGAKHLIAFCLICSHPTRVDDCVRARGVHETARMACSLSIPGRDQPAFTRAREFRKYPRAGRDACSSSGRPRWTIAKSLRHRAFEAPPPRAPERRCAQRPYMATRLRADLNDEGSTKPKDIRGIRDLAEAALKDRLA